MDFEQNEAGLANARLAAIVNSSDDAIVGKTLTGIITAWNRGAERLFGYTAEEAIGRHISLIAPPERKEEMRQILVKLAAGETIDHFETQRRRKDGALIDISVTISPIYDGAGRIVGASKIARDISERKRVWEGKGLLAAVVDSSDDAIISTDLNGIVMSWNKSAERLLGYGDEEMIGRHITTISPPGREPEMMNILARIRGGERVEHFETQRRRKDGGLADISLSVSPIYDGDGRIIGASKIARDIGERRRADERLKLLMRELDHRAKNVLAIAQAMLRLTHAETVSEYVNAVEGRIRALARVHSRVAENRWDGADLQGLVTADFEMFPEPEKRVSAKGEPLWVSPAAAQVIAILLHELSTNAARHGALSTDAGAVSVEWRRDEHGDLHLEWRERGGPPVSAPRRRGFGTQIVERSINDQLGGEARIDWLPEGMVCAFVIPAAHIVERRAQAPAGA